MLIGILSDTHDEFERTARAVATLKERGVACLIHCGDLFSGEVVKICSELPFHFVFGNHDADMVNLLQNAANEFGANCMGWSGVLQFQTKRIGVAHGHLTTDLAPLFVEQPDYILSGHFHEPKDWFQQGIRRINPGALHRADEYFVATLDIETDQLHFIPID
ncbi:metallophosphatase family protein [bacterium]|nr:metallophosphatase family protein [bacterium]